MEMAPYLSFNGDCEAAFTFYERCLGARVGTLFRYAGTPFAGDVPADWSDKVMHGSITVGNQVLMAADVAPGRYEAPRGFALSIHTGSAADAERMFHALAENGRIVAPLEKTFWAERFGVVVDRFGIQWLIACENAAEPSA